MSRRASTLTVQIPRRPRSGPVPIVVDSTGLKVFGEGEWKVRQHGIGKRRIGRKIHLAVDEAAKDMIGMASSRKSKPRDGPDGRARAGITDAACLKP